MTPNANGRIYPSNSVYSWMRDWMEKLKGEKVQIGTLDHPDHNEEFIKELQRFKWEYEFPPVFNKKNRRFEMNEPIGLLCYVDYVYDDGEMHLKSNRKRIILQFNWMEELNYGTDVL